MKTQNHEKIQRAWDNPCSLIAIGILMLMGSRDIISREVNKGTRGVVTHFDSYKFWHVNRSYSKQRSYTKQNFSCPNWTYTKLDLFQRGRISRYHCIIIDLVLFFSFESQYKQSFCRLLFDKYKYISYIDEKYIPFA